MTNQMTNGPLCGLFEASGAKWKAIATAIVGAALLTIGADASAGCNRSSGEHSYTLTIGNVRVTSEDAVNKVLARKRFTLVSADTRIGRCLSAGTGHTEVLQGALLPGFDSVYSTSVKGIGIRLAYYNGEGSVAYVQPSSVSNYARFTNVVEPSSAYYEVEIIKTEAVTGSGPLTPGLFNRVYFDGDGAGSPAKTIFIAANGITIVKPTCEVDAGSKNITVPLGKVPVTNFKGVGSTAGTRPFRIQLNCSAGTESSNIFLRMDATPDPSGQQGVLQLTQGAGVATGVGIQVLDQASVGVAFGQDALVGPSKDGSYIVPYTARYFQTAPDVTVGPANGVATFTINYK